MTNVDTTNAYAVLGDKVYRLKDLQFGLDNERQQLVYKFEQRGLPLPGEDGSPWRFVCELEEV
jgi:hypothetical protein